MAEMEEKWNYLKEATISVSLHRDPHLQAPHFSVSQDSDFSLHISQTEEFPGRDLLTNQHQHSPVIIPAPFQSRKSNKNY